MLFNSTSELISCSTKIEGLKSGTTIKCSRSNLRYIPDSESISG